MDDNSLRQNESFQSLEDKIQTLEEELTAAAEAGLVLLKSNQELHEKYEKDALYYQTQIEELKQQNHTLSNKLSIQESAHQGFLDELDHVKSQTESNYKQQLNMMEQNHSLKIQQMKWELQETKSELERGQDKEKGLREKVSLQEEIIKKLQEEEPTTSDSMKDELIDLQRKYNMLNCQKQDLESQLTDQVHAITQLNDEVSVHHSKLKEVEESLTDRVKLSNELYHSLQEVQETNKALNAQVEKYKLEQLEEDWQGKGNSLFGEVEERRLETERKLISSQVKYDTLERSHQMLKSHFKKLKAEMSALLCRHSTFSADLAHVDRLQANLRQRDSEIMRLNDKIRKLGKEIQDKKAVCVSSEDTKGKRFIEYFQNQLELKDKSLCSVRKELELQATQLAWERTKITTVEAQLHKSEQEKAKLINDATKMRLRLQEVKEKENEMNTQLKMAENEISTLKKQLKVNLRKGHQIEEAESTNADITPSTKTAPTKTTTIVKEEKREPINLLEEIEKENSCPPPPPLIDTSNPHYKTVLYSSSLHNDINAANLKTGTVSPSPLSKTKQDEDIKSPPAPLSSSSLKVIKAEDNVNRCPQQ